MTALHLAAKYGNLEACHYIMTLGNGSKFINAQDDGGWTPLVWGCEHQRFHIVKFVCFVISGLNQDLIGLLNSLEKTYSF